MVSFDSVQHVYGDRRWVVRLHVTARSEQLFTNRDLLSVFHTVDDLIRRVTIESATQLLFDLGVGAVDGQELTSSLRNLPAGAFDTGEVVELHASDIHLVIELPDLAVVGLALYLLKHTVAQDIRAVWSDTNLSGKVQSALLTNIPRALSSGAANVRHRLSQVGRFGSRFRVEETKMRENASAQEIDLEVEAERTQLIASPDDWPGRWLE